MSFTVIIPTFNYARYLLDAIRSAMAAQAHEIIVVDDASTDDTQAVLREFTGRVTVITKTVNEGLLAACRTGFSAASGDVVVFLDADDLLTPDALAAHAEVFARNPACVVSLGWMDVIDGNGTVLPSRFFHQLWTTGNRREELLRQGRLSDWPYTSGSAWKREVLRGPLLDHQPDIRNILDGYLHSVVALFGEYGATTTVVARYRVHGQNDGFAAARNVSRAYREEVEKILALDHFAKAQGLPFDPQETLDRSLKYIRNFLAWTILGADTPRNLPVMTRLRAFRLTLNRRPSLIQCKQVAWILALTILPRSRQRILAHSVINQLKIL